MDKMKKSEIALIAYEVVAGVGIDTILTGIAKIAVPTAIGIPGLFQKVCIKAATLGISFVAVDAMDKCVKTTAKELVESFEEELEKQAAK